jgi:hypothetical protein
VVVAVPPEPEPDPDPWLALEVASAGSELPPADKGDARAGVAEEVASEAPDVPEKPKNDKRPGLDVLERSLPVAQELSARITRMTRMRTGICLRIVFSLLFLNT